MEGRWSPLVGLFIALMLPRTLHSKCIRLKYVTYMQICFTNLVILSRISVYWYLKYKDSPHGRFMIVSHWTWSGGWLNKVLEISQANVGIFGSSMLRLPRKCCYLYVLFLFFLLHIRSILESSGACFCHSTRITGYIQWHIRMKVLQSGRFQLLSSFINAWSSYSFPLS